MVNKMRKQDFQSTRLFTRMVADFSKCINGHKRPQVSAQNAVHVLHGMPRESMGCYESRLTLD